MTPSKPTPQSPLQSTRTRILLAALVVVALGVTVWGVFLRTPAPDSVASPEATSASNALAEAVKAEEAKAGGPPALPEATPGGRRPSQSQ